MVFSESGGTGESKGGSAGSQEANFKSIHEVIWKGFFPSAYAMGISYEDFKHMNPKELEYVKDGYIKKIQQIDYMNWLNGRYTMQAVAVAIEANFAKNPKGKYYEEQFLSRIETEEERVERLRKEFALKMATMRENFNLRKEKQRLKKITDGA